jgi:NitT/TauT family transport system substrate-binding protein
MRKGMSTLAVVLVTAVSAAGCGASSSTGGNRQESANGKTTQVTVGVVPIVDVAPLYLGEKKGFFKAHGISLKIQTAQGGAAVVPGVVSGNFQFGFSNVTSLMIAQTKGMPIKSVISGVASTGKAGADNHTVAVKADSPIKSPKDLAGRTVSVNTLQNIFDTAVRESVRKDGGDPRKVKFVEIPPEQGPTALLDGQVDAAVTGQPWLAILKSKGRVREVAWPLVDTYPKLTVATYFTSTKLIQQNPQLVKNFKAAMTESLKYASAHPDEARRTVSSYTKIDSAILKQLTVPSWPTEINMASLKQLASLSEKDGIFGDKKPDLNALFS